MPKIHIALYVLGALVALYAAFWLGVYLGQRHVLRAWLPWRRKWRLTAEEERRVAEGRLR